MDEFRRRFEDLYRRSAAGACPPGEALSDLAANRTWPWQRRRLLAHLQECSDCADDVRAIRAARPDIAAALRAHDMESRTGSWRIGSWRPGPLAAAAAALAVSVGIATFLGGVPTERNGGGTVIFASEFEPGSASERPEPLFRSDFGDERRSGELRDG